MNVVNEIKDLYLIERYLRQVQKEHVAHSCSRSGEYHEFFALKSDECPWCSLSVLIAKSSAVGGGGY